MRSRGSWELEFEDLKQPVDECARKRKGGPAHALSREAGEREGLRRFRHASLSSGEHGYLLAAAVLPVAGASQTSPEVLGAAAATEAELERPCKSSVGSVRREEFVGSGSAGASELCERNSVCFFWLTWRDWGGEAVSVAQEVWNSLCSPVLLRATGIMDVKI